MKKLILMVGILWSGLASAGNGGSQDLLIKFTDTETIRMFSTLSQNSGSKVEVLGNSNWVHVQLSEAQLKATSLDEIRANPRVLAVQPNYKLHLLENYQVKSPKIRAKLAALLKAREKSRKKAALLGTPMADPMPADNPPIPMAGSGGTGTDPLFVNQWGMNDMGVQKAWSGTPMGAGITVAVIDTGVDYTHEDLVDNLWRNPGEMGTDAQGRDKSSNGVDDDANGFIDDVIGWDFASNDNKPFDLAVEPIKILMGGGNPGHGTHCAGNVAARAGNGKGTVGVAPMAKIMALRFLTEKGEGTTADAVKAIDYAVKMGAQVLSNSWGGEGEDPAEAKQNQALKDSITAAQNAGVLFIAAAGNGHSGVGYDNDTDAKPGYPASYDHENIISVAAIDSTNALGGFSNWGVRSVDIAAPGVKVFSTTVGGKYSDTVIDLMGITATWDGTSMACPHVAGAAALYWSAHPHASWREVKKAILDSAVAVPALQGKILTGGKLNAQSLMK